MKIIVLIHHDRHSDDHISVFAYSDENLEIVKKKMEEYLLKEKSIMITEYINQ